MISPFEVLSSALRNQALVRALATRDIAGRYRGSALGNVWALATPIIMLLVYTFVFGLVFKSRWRGGSQNTYEFSVLMFSGLIIYNFAAEVINRAPNLVTQNANFVKKIVFPLEILPWVALAAAFFHFLVSFGVLLVGVLAVFGGLHWTLLLAPVVFLPIVFFVMGSAWLLASLGVFLRDLPQLVPIGMTVLLFLAPIFYPLEAVPPVLQWVVIANPLSIIIEDFRDVVVLGIVPAAGPLLLYLAIAWSFAWLAYVWFQKTRRGFADVI